MTTVDLYNLNIPLTLAIQLPGGVDLMDDSWLSDFPHEWFWTSQFMTRTTCTCVRVVGLHEDSS
jgi:hypothetical protein